MQNWKVGFQVFDITTTRESNLTKIALYFENLCFEKSLYHN